MKQGDHNQQSLILGLFNITQRQTILNSKPGKFATILLLNSAQLAAESSRHLHFLTIKGLVLEDKILRTCDSKENKRVEQEPPDQ